MLHGAAVMTQDVDLLVKAGAATRSKVWRFAQAMGGEPPLPLSELAGARGVSGKPLIARILIPGAVPIDVIFGAMAGGLDFATVRQNSTLVPVAGRTLRTASLEDVIASKAAADRPKDRASLPHLQAALAVLRARNKP